MLFKKVFSLLSLMIGIGAANSAFASVCYLASGSPSAATIAIPPLANTVTLSPAAIGGIMATQRLLIRSTPSVYYCDSYVGATNSTSFIMTNNPSLEPSGLPKVYKTSVPGVGIRIGFTATDNPTWWGPARYPHFAAISSRERVSPPSHLVIEFVRTGMAVGKGPITFNYDSTYSIFTTPTTYTYITGTSLKTNVVNNIYFSGCETENKAITVPMGKIPSDNVRRGNAPRHDFNFGVSCKGISPGQPMPVKVYFEGSTTSNGLLSLSSMGQNGVASGVGIELTDSKGARLPFNKANPVDLDWQHSTPDAEVYRFSGKARYAASGGEVKPGKADGTLTYVLVYN